MNNKKTTKKAPKPKKEKAPVVNAVNIDKLRRLIDNKQTENIAREKIAKSLKCNVSTITHHYNRDRGVTVDFLKKYAQYFNVTADYLLDLTDNPTTDENLRFVCDYLGIREETAYFLKYADYSLKGFIENFFSKAFEDEIDEHKEFLSIIGDKTEKIKSEDFNKAISVCADIYSLNSIIKNDEAVLSGLGNEDDLTDAEYETFEDAKNDSERHKGQKAEKEFALNGFALKVATQILNVMKRYIDNDEV